MRIVRCCIRIFLASLGRAGGPLEERTLSSLRCESLWLKGSRLVLNSAPTLAFYLAQPIVEYVAPRLSVGGQLPLAKVDIDE